MRAKHSDRTSRCPVEACLEIIGGKWKGVILFHLLGGTKRFNELRKLLAKVTQRMLTRQLRELEADHIIERTVYLEVPPRVEYSLTDFGKTLVPILELLEKWGLEHIDQITARREYSAQQGAPADVSVAASRRQSRG